jgi:hypothetical protein
MKKENWHKIIIDGMMEEWNYGSPKSAIDSLPIFQHSSIPSHYLK